MTTIRAFSARKALLRFRSDTWRSLLGELDRRGERRREAGVFLLADRRGNSRVVDHVVYLDDLDPDCLQGGICFDGRAYSSLWDICDVRRARVIGDVHTHPAGVRQSNVDRDNPMIARSGHVALIVPDLASRYVTPAEVGVHLYSGTTGWQSWTGREASRRLYVGRWPGR